MNTSNVSKTKRKRRRKRIVMMQKMGIALIMTLVLVGGTMFIISSLPGIQVEKQIKEGNSYIEEQAYEEAIASYQAALQIDSQSVEAYRAMAGAYLDKEDTKAAEQILFDGWESTKDEGLLQYYCTVMLNEAVAEINEQKCTFHTASKCMIVLEKDNSNADAINLLNICSERLLQESEAADENNRFCSTLHCNNACEFSQYLNIMERLYVLYEEQGNEELKELLSAYSVPKTENIVFALAHMTQYKELLEKINKIQPSSDVEQIIACLSKAAWVQETFAPAFASFDAGEFEQIKEFMNNDTYISIRDEFIAGSMEYWSGKTYIPVSREKIRLLYTDSGYRFAFLDFDECQGTKGVINVWGAKQEDAGVQRVAISYEPASGDDTYYPHITYEIIYLYSNVKLGEDNYVPEMNYRFETKTATEEGITTDLIGDWGGNHEWKTTY